MKKQRGAILLVTLLMNVVIVMLVIANMRSLLLNTKVLHAYQNKQISEYQLLYAHKKWLAEINFPLQNCIYITNAGYKFFSVDNRFKWCEWSLNKNQKYLYRIWDDGLDCCLETSAQGYAHFYTLQFKNINNKRNNLYLATIVRSEVNENCFCKNKSVIRDGEISHIIV